MRGLFSSLSMKVLIKCFAKVDCRCVYVEDC